MSRKLTPVERIERALSEIEIALNEDVWPIEIIRAYQALSAAMADYTEGKP